ncbi:hypothetical protein [Corallincola spongiicola]|uniref:DUF5610 domain-containing protein n=1 Tax=Corallincola spongiicola TaxID=2520508 RepID=A0ABY1WPS9_9GAMM|nr:hypothetical protein [Corallincola spongiicola]TAA46085.1 hypothetical protein EXY25_12160 [Corallincola spongiicola]
MFQFNQQLFSNLSTNRDQLSYQQNYSATASTQPTRPLASLPSAQPLPDAVAQSPLVEPQAKAARVDKALSQSLSERFPAVATEPASAYATESSKKLQALTAKLYQAQSDGASRKELRAEYRELRRDVRSAFKEARSDLKESGLFDRDMRHTLQGEWKAFSGSLKQFRQALNEPVQPTAPQAPVQMQTVSYQTASFNMSSNGSEVNMSFSSQQYFSQTNVGNNQPQQSALESKEIAPTPSLVSESQPEAVAIAERPTGNQEEAAVAVLPQAEVDASAEASTSSQPLSPLSMLQQFLQSLPGAVGAGSYSMMASSQFSFSASMNMQSGNGQFQASYSYSGSAQFYYAVNGTQSSQQTGEVAGLVGDLSELADQYQSGAIEAAVAGATNASQEDDDTYSPGTGLAQQNSAASEVVDYKARLLQVEEGFKQQFSQQRAMYEVSELIFAQLNGQQSSNQTQLQVEKFEQFNQSVRFN